MLARLQTVDGRFIPADDPRVLAILLRDYVPVVEEDGWRLLRREPVSPVPSWTPLSSVDIELGASIPVPERTNALVWTRMEVVPTVLGRLRAFFYKAAEVRLVVDDGISARRFRLLAPAARGGFLVAPLLRDADDFRDLFDGSGSRLAKSLIVDVAPSARKYYRSKVAVEFAAAPPRGP